MFSKISERLEHNFEVFLQLLHRRVRLSRCHELIKAHAAAKPLEAAQLSCRFNCSSSSTFLLIQLHLHCTF
jgi:hypothetical protein